jgi:hypothetical protein
MADEKEEVKREFCTRCLLCKEPIPEGEVYRVGTFATCKPCYDEYP